MTAATLRVAGATLLATAGWLTGRTAALPFARRVEELRGFELVLARLESAVRWEGREIGAALAEAAVGTAPGVRRTVETFLTRGSLEARPTAELWREALEEAGYLRAEDRAVLRALGEVLGRFSRAEQAQHLAAVRERLRVLAQEAERERAEQGRALATLMALGGAAIAVLAA
jgi:stage III sporulation protein AB